MIDASIILGQKPLPAIDPLGIATKAAQYRNLISETANRDQQTQTSQQKQIREQQQNAEADRELAAQKTEGELMAQNTTQGSDGQSVVNHQAVVQGLAQAGYGKQASTYVARVQIPDEKARLDNQTNALNAAEKKLGLIGQGLGALQGVSDPNLPQAHDEEVAKLEHAGVVKPGEIPSAAQIMGPTGDINLLKQAHQTAQLQTVKGTEQIAAKRADAEFSQRLIEFKQQVAEKAPKIQQDWMEHAAQVFQAAKTPEQWQAAQQTLRSSNAPVGVVMRFGDFSADAPARAQQLGMTPEQKTTAAQAAARDTEAAQRDAEAARHNLADEQNKKAEIHLAQQKFQAEFGGDAVKGWAATIKDNPDAAASVPAALRSGVQQEFSKTTGLPFPKPLAGQALEQERGARNVMAALQQISEDVKDPEIQSRLGPVLGRLGNAEQDVGATVGLSTEAAAKAQRLRSNMRTMVFQDGKAMFGARIPGNILEQLQTSSPRVNMDAPTLQGALEGTQDQALRALDAAEQQRFGGKMRSRADRGVSEIQFGGATNPLPAKLSASDVGKTYTNKAGKLIKITAVNPADPTQFKFEEAK